MVLIVRIQLPIVIVSLVLLPMVLFCAEPPSLPPSSFSTQGTATAPLPMTLPESAVNGSAAGLPTPDAVIADTSPPKTSLNAGSPRHISAKVIYLSRSATLELSADDTGEVSSGISSLEYHFDASPDWKRYTEPISLQNRSEGLHTLSYRSRDRAGNVEQTQTAHIFIDETAPATILTIGTPQSKSPDGRLFISERTPLSIAATEQGSGTEQIEYRLGKNEWSVYREPFRIADEGEHRLEYRGVDNVGNVETVRTLSLVVDNTPPITALSANNQTPDATDSIIINRPVTVTLDPYDMLSGVKSTEYRIDQGKWLPYAPFRVEGNTSHAISFRSIDNAVNQEQIKTVNIKIDRSPPISSITIGEPHITSADGSTVVSEITFFNISAKDNLSAIEMTEYRIDDGEWQEYQPFNIQNEGRHKIEFRSRDLAGNIEPPRHINVTVITTPPTTGISVNNKPYESGSIISSTLPFSLAVNIRNAGAGIKTTEYRLDGSKWAPFKPFIVTAEGEHIVEVRSIDKLGNTETTRFVKLLIDQSPPQTELMIGEPKRIDNGIVYITDKTVLALSAKDPLSGVAKSEYIIEGTSELHGSEPFNILTGGEYRIRFWSIDSMGNREKERMAPVVVEVSKPSVQDAMAAVNKPTYMSAQEADKKNQTDSDIPDSIRIAAKPAETQEKKEPPPDQAIPSELMIDPLFNNMAPNAPERLDPEQNKKLFTSGGINAVIIAIIMLIL